MPRFLLNTRYIILVPIVGLSIAAAMIFLFGGLGLLRVLLQGISIVLNPNVEPIDHVTINIEAVEYVHMFLVGTTLYLTAIGLYQLFIEKVEFQGWLKIDHVEELETNLIGMTVVVLAVNFMVAAFTQDAQTVLNLGVGSGVAIAALGLFTALRAWTSRSNRSQPAELPKDSDPQAK
jgi:uncharacterized membrane protein YqhA